MSYAERSGEVGAADAVQAVFGHGEGERRTGSRGEGSARRSARSAPPRRHPVARAWDLSRIAVGFSYFGLGGWVLAACVLPLQRLADRWQGRSDADLRAQRTLHAGARSFLGLAGRMGLVQVEWRDDAAIDRGPVLVVANHPSLIDSPIFAARMPQVDFLVSPAWSANPWLRGLVTAAGYVRADGGADSVKEAAARLRAGRSVVIYPEGTRTPPEGMGRLHRGAAHVALEAGCDLLPVWIRTEPRTLMKGQSWMDYPAASRPRWIVEVGEPIRPAEHLDGSEPRALAARRLIGVLRGWFETRSRRDEA